MFQVGDKVVYPNHGVGQIKDVKEFEIGGHVAKFFEVYILSSKSTVKVPAGNADAVGLRHLLNREKIETVYSYLRNEEILRYDDWKERFKQNSDLMRTGKAEDVAKVLKNLHLVSQEKPLSFREKRMYERAQHLIATEIAEVKKSPVREIDDQISKALSIGMKELGVESNQESGS
jgi:CarD family transcriptional regulator